MSKAYDRVEWSFLKGVMLKVGFFQKWVDIVFEKVSSVKYHVLHEDRQFGPVVPSRGLRQGDPLSPYLFLFIAEGLSALMERQVARKVLHAESLRMRGVLEEYERAYGQQINFDKSMICFSSNTQHHVRSEVASILGVGEGDTSEKYMGLPSLVERRKKEILGFLKGLCKEIETMMNAYWWTGSIGNGKEIGNNPSYIWRGMMEVQDLLRSGCKRCIEDGRTTRIGVDPWLPDAINPFVETQLHETIKTAPVYFLLNMRGTGWDFDLLNDVFDQRDAKLIVNIPISKRTPPDTWTWAPDTKGNYTVRSCYRKQIGEQNDARPWVKIWNLEIPPKDESAIHLFATCCEVRKVWQAVNPQVTTPSERFCVEKYSVFHGCNDANCFVFVAELEEFNEGQEHWLRMTIGNLRHRVVSS
ncbi:PREDICTED: uncharacterized protein LOC109167866 [Ipomoea nil]|uniref:uncharacterized protein LOC109167866 n=1 Tax=Ipomoea nil TaxID=35883 RepID=UPI00090137A6|nr:PREDICTED: uncharacterized protein LOC109167866 [Ipomoea nil]